MHTHTTSSDGLLSPGQLVEKAFQRRLDGIAITDHDSVDGLIEAIEKAEETGRITVIPGVEMACSYEEEEVHILGYFIDYKDVEFLDTLKTLRDSRWIRGIQILEKLDSLGINLPKEEILEKAKEKEFIGRATIARDLVSNKYVKDIKEAFDKYLDVGKPAYVDRFKLSIQETIDLIHGIGGISILAHPGLLRDKDIMTECVKRGIMGLECHHPKHTREQTIAYKSYAKRAGLIITGGSDFHGEDDNLGDYTTDLELIPEFKERL